MNLDPSVDHTDMIHKLKQFVGSNQDDFIEYDDSLQTEEFNTIDDEVDFRQKQKKSTNFNNMLIHQNSSLSQKRA
jgi:hypothetical protein